MKPDAVIFDIDGTLLIRNGREPFEWALAETDIVNQPMIDLAKILDRAGYGILVVSGREHWLSSVTVPKIDGALGFAPSYFFRKNSDFRADSEIKMEIYVRDIEPEFKVHYVFDDRDQTVDMWRNLGLPTLQVAYGAF